MPLLEGLQLPGLVVATLLPWLAGVSVAHLLLRHAPWTLLLGHGYLLGQLLVIVLLLLWGQLGLTLAWWPLASLLGLVTAIAASWVWWRGQSQVAGNDSAPELPLPAPSLHWRDLLWLLPLLAFLWLRGSVVVEELALRPLFPWDAWMNWVPRAAVWFEHGNLTSFGSPQAWLQAAPGTEFYTLGNRPAGDYPPAIPLLLLWHMLGADTADHTLIYLPWLLLSAAAALALWGHLRACHLARAPAALAVYVLLSMPLPTTHVALAGYADLWLGVAFGLGAMALAQWQYSACPRYASLTLAMALFCALLKNPGLGFALLLAGGVVLMLWRPPLRWLVGLTLAGLALLLTGLLAGLHPDWVAQLDAWPALQLPAGLPELKLRLSPLLPYLGQTFYQYDNWHLLGILLPFALLASLLTGGPRSLCDIALLMLVAGFAVLVLVFGFTQYAVNVPRGITFHRAFLYVVPLAVFVAFARLAPLLPHRERGSC